MHTADLENELMVVTTTTYDRCLREKHGADAFALYMFYYRMAKKQQTLQPKATPNYCMKGLRWGEQRFNNADKLLRHLELVEKKLQRGADGKIAGWYVRLKYVGLSPEAPKTTPVETPEGGKQGTNALIPEDMNALIPENHAHEGPPVPPTSQARKKTAKVSTHKKRPKDELTEPSAWSAAFIARWNKTAQDLKFLGVLRTGSNTFHDAAWKLNNELEKDKYFRENEEKFWSALPDVGQWMRDWHPSLMQICFSRNKAGELHRECLIEGSYADAEIIKAREEQAAEERRRQEQRAFQERMLREMEEVEREQAERRRRQEEQRKADGGNAQ
jgi:hypothetical protein